jgi:diaminopropionate ammonia-lyase
VVDLHRNALHGQNTMLDPQPFTVFANPRAGTPGLIVLPETGFHRARNEIAAWPGYAPSPLRDLPAIARDTKIATLRLKDEAGRFGLGSFKALGGGYAVADLLANELARRGVAPTARATDLMAGRWREVTETITVTSATDGNHGRAVAWGAQRCHCRAVIFLHETVSVGREAAIAAYGAEIRRTPGNYDDAVRRAAIAAEAQGWFVVSDTSWPGYMHVPQAIMQGYRVMAAEATEQWSGAPPTHVFIQGGVGGVAAAVSVQMRAAFTPAPQIVVVEPDRSACLLASAQLGERTSIPGDLDTLMAGLACGEPSPLAWQELERGAAAFMAIPDTAAVATMRLLAQAGIVAGESGVAGLAGCLLAAADPVARETLGLDAASRVLVFSTEGATDPELYAELVGSGPG